MSLRLNGQILLAGAIGAILASLFTFLIPGPEGPTDIGSIPTNVVAVLSGLLLLVGLPALCRAQAKQIGRVGLVGVVLLWIAAVSNLLVLTGVQLLDLTVRGVIPHTPGVHGPPPLAVISAVLGGVLILIGGVMVGITTIRAHVFAAALGWVILISSVLLIPTAFVGGALLSTILGNTDFVLFYAGLAWAGAAISFPRMGAL